MAAVVAQTRTAVASPLGRMWRMIPLLPSLTVAIPAPARLGGEGLLRRLAELVGGAILRAVPKNKTSHSRKRMRQLASGKHLKDKSNLNHCPVCGAMKLSHHTCNYCYRKLKEAWKTAE